MMRRTGALVSGSTTLHYLCGDGESWSLNDLDVYVGDGPAYRDLIQYLLESEGYTLDMSPSLRYTYGYPFKGFLNIHHLSKVKAGKTVSIDVIQSLTDEAVEPILRFHSTLVMNWLSCNSVSIRFAGTLHRQGELSPYGVIWDRDVVTHWRKKYQSQGFVVTNMGGLGLALSLIWWGINSSQPTFLIWSEFIDGMDVYEGMEGLTVQFNCEVSYYIA
ncbi:hypothetical protein FRB99_003690 [Tulasnella sp. 403]|nr:hypothetical protein FRB99_003690 [Tulasnella sp. 403]